LRRSVTFSNRRAEPLVADQRLKLLATILAVKFARGLAVIGKPDRCQLQPPPPDQSDRHPKNRRQLPHQGAGQIAFHGKLSGILLQKLNY
jgi:hypothetical protein